MDGLNYSILSALAIMKKWVFFGVQSLIIILVVAILLEGVVAFSLYNPTQTILPLSLTRNIYNRFDRKVIQVLPECAVYDSYLTYKLKPGSCEFGNREFSNVYEVNSEGLRDDEASLIEPKVIMLGDSITMGWGVDQEETFANLFEKQTGYKTLNAGISSYGTVREFRLLESLDLSNAKFLIIQYMDNDISENKTLFFDKEIKILSKKNYEDTVRKHESDLVYYPGKYAFNVLIQLQSFIRKVLTKSQKSQKNATNKEQEATYFLNVLLSAKIDLSNLNIIVFEVSAHANDSNFEKELRKQLQRNGNPEWVKRIKVMDVENLLNEQMYYVLDDHPNSMGHIALANALVKFIE